MLFAILCSVDERRKGTCVTTVGLVATTAAGLSFSFSSSVVAATMVAVTTAVVTTTAVAAANLS